MRLKSEFKTIRSELASVMAEIDALSKTIDEKVEEKYPNWIEKVKNGDDGFEELMIKVIEYEDRLKEELGYNSLRKRKAELEKRLVEVGFSLVKRSPEWNGDSDVERLIQKFLDDDSSVFPYRDEIVDLFMRVSL